MSEQDKPFPMRHTLCAVVADDEGVSRKVATALSFGSDADAVVCLGALVKQSRAPLVVVPEWGDPSVPSGVLPTAGRVEIVEAMSALVRAYDARMREVYVAARERCREADPTDREHPRLLMPAVLPGEERHDDAIVVGFAADRWTHVVPLTFDDAEVAAAYAALLRGKHEVAGRLLRVRTTVDIGRGSPLSTTTPPNEVPEEWRARFAAMIEYEAARAACASVTRGVLAAFAGVVRDDGGGAR